MYKYTEWEDLSIIALYSYVLENGVFYGPDHKMLCPGGSRMRLQLNERRGRWRCHGILDSSNGVRCCNGSDKSARTDSFFFAGRYLLNGVTLSILYGWAMK